MWSVFQNDFASAGKELAISFGFYRSARSVQRIADPVRRRKFRGMRKLFSEFISRGSLHLMRAQILVNEGINARDGG